MTKQQRILKLLKSPPGRPIWSDGRRFATHQEAGGYFGKRTLVVKHSGVTIAQVRVSKRMMVIQ